MEGLHLQKNTIFNFLGLEKKFALNSPYWLYFHISKKIWNSLINNRKLKIDSRLWMDSYWLRILPFVERLRNYLTLNFYTTGAVQDCLPVDRMEATIFLSTFSSFCGPDFMDFIKAKNDAVISRKKRNADQ